MFKTCEYKAQKTRFICNHVLSISTPFAMPVAHNYYLDTCRQTFYHTLQACKFVVSFFFYQDNSNHDHYHRPHKTDEMQY
jgi:hypothetical protein